MTEKQKKYDVISDFKRQNYNMSNLTYVLEIKYF